MTEPELLVPLTPDAAHPVSLVCIPHAGAGVASFHPWRELGGLAALWAVRFPGRESRVFEPPLTSIEDMAEALAPLVSEIAARTIVLFGHCSGALVAYEVAARLAQRRSSAADLLLVLSSQPAPFGRPQPAGRGIAGLSPADFADRLRALGGTPDVVLNNPQMMALMEPTIRADLLAVERYRPPAREALPYDIVVMAGRGDHAVPADSLQAWQDCTAGSFRIEWFDGQHFFVSEDGKAVVRYLAELLRSIG